MKQILITPEILTMAKEYAKNLFTDKKSSFVQPVQGLKNLIIDLQEVNDSLDNRDKYITYLKEIIKDYKKLKNLLPTDFSRYKTKYDSIISEELLSTIVKHRKVRLPSKKTERYKLNTSSGVFYQLIVDRMHYADTRLYLGPYMKKIGINTCVYCNIAEATYSPKLKEVYYPFDHGKPKSKYPFLCICFFNLYPCCTNCNVHKLDDDKEFQLYVTSEPVSDPFVFKIDRNKVEEGNPHSVEIGFKARNSADNDMADKYNADYRIEEFYNSEAERRNSYQMLHLIYKLRASYPAALEASIPIIVDREKLFSETLGVKDDENIFTDSRKKLKLDTAKDAKLL